jgi:GNAT superfamily N-acetyltransferase
MPLTIRPAARPDAPAMAALLNDLIARGGSTAHREPFDAAGIAATFIEPKLGICCFCADDGGAGDGGAVAGFQALEWADPDWPGPDRLPAGWAIVATYVAAGRHGEGIGRRPFAATLGAARAARVSRIDATIRRENARGLGYYAGMGFSDYRTGDATVSKMFRAS